MNEITQNDVVAVGGGVVRCGERVRAQSSTPALAARAAADVGSEGGGGAEWHIVTRGKARAGGVKRTTMRSRPSVLEGGEGSQQAPPSFEAAATAARKRKAEDSVNDKLTVTAAIIEQLMATQREMAESQKAFLESNRMILDRNKELTKMIKAQARRSRPCGH